MEFRAKIFNVKSVWRGRWQGRKGRYVSKFKIFEKKKEKMKSKGAKSQRVSFPGWGFIFYLNFFFSYKKFEADDDEYDKKNIYRHSAISQYYNFLRQSSLLNELFSLQKAEIRLNIHSGKVDF